VLIVKVVEAASPAAREFPQVLAVFVAVIGLCSGFHGGGGFLCDLSIKLSQDVAIPKINRLALTPASVSASRTAWRNPSSSSGLKLWQQTFGAPDHLGHSEGNQAHLDRE
jgi:hypothetical protein